MEEIELTKEAIEKQLEGMIFKELEDMEDFEYFCPNYLKIKDEQGNILPFILNDAQIKFYNVIKEASAAGKRLWFIILKPRQLGFSTLIQAIIFHHNLFNAQQKALTMGHKLDASNNLYAIYKRYYDNLPTFLRPQTEKSNEKKLSYLKLGSENKVDTAKAGEVGRSDTYQVVHLTEIAFYPDPKTTLLGLMQGSKHAKYFFLETTANGFNEFRNRWTDARNGIGDFIPFFISWLEFPPYQMRLEQGESDDLYKSMGANPVYNAYMDEEVRLMKDHKATLGQLKWRRWAIDNLCNRDVYQFHQEYPTTEEEAFLSSGSPVFTSLIVQRNLTESKGKTFKRGNIEYVRENDKITGVEFVETEKGFIKLFTLPDIKEGDRFRFCGGCDVSEGLAQGDRSIIKVLDRKTMEVILTWAGYIHPDLLAEEQHKISLFLKRDIYMATEINNHGLTTVTSSFKLGVKQYYRETFDTGMVENQNDKIGFKTTIQTKPLIINDLNQAMREGEFKDYETKFWEECLTFVRNERGRMSAQNKESDPGSKCYDDRVIASAIMWKCHLWLPNYLESTPDNSPKWLQRLKQQKKESTSAMSA